MNRMKIIGTSDKESENLLIFLSNLHLICLDDMLNDEVEKLKIESYYLVENDGVLI